MAPPGSHNLPENVTAYIEGDHENFLFALCKGGRSIVIQGSKPSDYVVDRTDLKSLERQRKDFFYVLEIIQANLGLIEFGKTNWAYLVQSKGRYHIQLKDKICYTITSPTWAPFIYESEINIVKWMGSNFRVGYWKGQEVDIQYGWNRSYLERVDLTMKMYRLLQPLDLTFEVVGHLIHNGGSVAGLVTEAATGRMATPSDRTLLYDALAKLQRHGFLFRGLLLNKVMISNGKVRLLDIADIHYYPESRRDELEEAAEFDHWESLEYYQTKMNPWELHSTAYRTWKVNLTLLAETPDPEKPLGSYARFWFPYIFFPEIMDARQTWLLKRAKKRGSNWKSSKAGPPVYLPTGEEPFTSNTTQFDIQTEGSSKRNPTLVDTSNQPLFHPYINRHRRTKLLLANNDDDSQ